MSMRHYSHDPHREDYELDEDPLRAARGIITAIGWSLGYGGSLIAILWSAKTLWMHFHG